MTIQKFIEILGTHVEANQELIKDHNEKTKKGKRTTRFKVSTFFVQNNLVMQQILDLLKDIKIISVSEVKKEGLTLRSLYEHYFEMAD